MKIALATLAFVLTALASGVAQAQAAWHPEIFSMVESWISDSESPVVTEVNLDAVQRNRNQFNSDGVKREDGWIFYRVPEGGFKRYRILEHEGNRYKLVFQDNGGGSLTTESRIEFTVDRRDIQVNGKPKTINVLRVTSYSR